jgi:copper chaperone NosL
VETPATQKENRKLKTMNNKLSARARILSLVCAVALGASLLFPLWRIDLTAPQYPEGLGLKIYPHKIGGDVDVVNGLNHYIGMRTLHTEDFIEFTVLPYLIAAFAVFGLLAFLINRRWFFYTWSVLFVLFGIVAMYDFYRWEYDYGHNLDPNAAIVVPGMAYQPPLIGFKQLLNFGAYSFPDVGGYIFLFVGLLLVVFTFLEWKTARKQRTSVTATAVVSMLLFLSSCSTGPQPISYGKDACHFCKMIISDKKFGAEVVTQKGKAYKFDDTHCLVAFLKSGSVDQKEIAATYLADYSAQEKLIVTDQAFLLKAESIRGPMGGTVAAFATEESMKQYQQQLQAVSVKWSEVVQ